ncbi:MAG: hypothetical protein HY695_38355 [Deltaproteobacteria bacterium]|nr:hypothetical protein [Deltaproteobacteria bacterium]
MQRFSVEVPLQEGGVTVQPMKEWLRRNPGHLPAGMSPASSTSHQIRAALKKRGWQVRETSDEVRLVMPRSAASGNDASVEIPAGPRPILSRSADKLWCWEGNVVCAVATFLTENGWIIESTADTARSEAGADIQARRHDQILIVEVKGYPSEVYERGPKAGQPKRTNPATQARHWVGEALMTAVLRQADGKAHQVALAFPEFSVYHKLLRRLEDCLKKLEVQLLFVNEAGKVRVVIDRGIGRT